jgi:hypothetical protein
MRTQSGGSARRPAAAPLAVHAPAAQRERVKSIRGACAPRAEERRSARVGGGNGCAPRGREASRAEAAAGEQRGGWRAALRLRQRARRGDGRRPSAPVHDDRETAG